MNELVNKSKIAGGLQVTNMDDLARLGNMMAKCGYFQDAKDATQCAVKILAGLELGMPAFASMTGIYIIKGKPSMGANLMAAMIKKSGKYNYKVHILNEKECKIEFFENGNSSGFSEFSSDDAKKALLTTGPNAHNWDKYSRNMLFSRAISNGIKWFCPDLFMGAPVYTPEELEVAVNEEGAPVKKTDYPVKSNFTFSEEKEIVVLEESSTIVPINKETGELINNGEEDHMEAEENHMILVNNFQDLLWTGKDPTKTWLAIKEKYNVEHPSQLDDITLAAFIDKFKNKTNKG